MITRILDKLQLVRFVSPYKNTLRENTTTTLRRVRLYVAITTSCTIALFITWGLTATLEWSSPLLQSATFVISLVITQAAFFGVFASSFSNAKTDKQRAIPLLALDFGMSASNFMIVGPPGSGKAVFKIDGWGPSLANPYSRSLSDSRYFKIYVGMFESLLENPSRTRIAAISFPEDTLQIVIQFEKSEDSDLVPQFACYFLFRNITNRNVRTRLSELVGYDRTHESPCVTFDEHCEILSLNRAIQFRTFELSIHHALQTLDVLIDKLFDSPPRSFDFRFIK